VKGKATNTLLFVDPGSLNFGRVDVSAPELRKEVTLINTSSQPLWVVVKLRNPEGSPFSVVEATALAEPIPPAGRVTFKVSFLPQVQGEAQNELQVWLQGGTEPEALIPMSGTGYGGSTEQPGGCSCGSTGAGSSGMLMLLALVGLVSRRRRCA
jgi:MYXO-CTERM domain-containing protein